MIIKRYFFWNKVEKRRSRRRDVFCIKEFELCSKEQKTAAILSPCHTVQKWGYNS